MPMEEIKRTDPTPVAVSKMIPAGTAGQATAKIVANVTVFVPFSTAGGTGNAGMVSWINPEPGTIIVGPVKTYFSVAGTGTFDIGVSDDGTGSNDEIFDGATMAGITHVSVSHHVAAATLGATNGWILGPGGTGTNNSIVGVVDETASTARGGLFITYNVVP